MARTPYRYKSRESQIMERVHAHMDRIVTSAAKDNPLPIGEERIDPRTARARLGMVPSDQLFEYLGGQG